MSVNEAAQYKKCPYCAETILAEALKCRYCGTDFNLEQERMAQIARRADEILAANKSIKEVSQTIRYVEEQLEEFGDKSEPQPLSWGGIIVGLLVLWFFMPNEICIGGSLVMLAVGLMLRSASSLSQSDMERKTQLVTRLNDLHQQKQQLQTRIDTLQSSVLAR